MHSSKGYNASTPADVWCSGCLLSILYAHILLECIVLPFFCGDGIKRALLLFTLTDINSARNLFQAIPHLYVEVERACSSLDATLGIESIPRQVFAFCG